MKVWLHPTTCGECGWALSYHSGTSPTMECSNPACKTFGTRYVPPVFECKPVVEPKKVVETKEEELPKPKPSFLTHGKKK